jgi:hypothetical protein
MVKNKSTSCTIPQAYLAYVLSMVSLHARLRFRANHAKQKNENNMIRLFS